jgi:hypothetical protein
MQRVMAIAVAFGISISAALCDEGLQLRSPNGGVVRAVVIGIDAYRHVRPLKGAVADALDIEDALRKTGVQDVTALIDAMADRSSVVSAINNLIARSGPRDLVILSLAGHGAQEPERVKGSQPDGVENVFLLSGFDNTPAGSQDRILGAEFNHFIKQFEARGAHVLFVADTCFGGGMTRNAEWRRTVNEMGEIPVLEDAGTKLTQTAPILLRLADRYGLFRGEREDELSEILRWLFWDNHKLTGYVATYRFQRAFTPSPEPAVLVFMRRRIDDYLGILENHLRDRLFVVGNGPTVIDICMSG